jgi:hypothetical protein
VYRRQVAPLAESVDTLITQTLRGAGGFDNPGLLSGATYAYRVQACDSRGCGELSAPVVAQLASGKLAAPKLLSVQAQSGTEALVSWSLDDQDATTTIEVYTSTEAKVGEPIDVPAGQRSYVVNTLRPLHNYLIRLRACTPDGCSPHSEDRPVSTPSSLSAFDFDGDLPADLTSQTVVDGLTAPMAFETTAGAIRATYQGDRVHIEVEPASTERFLVLNEMYHPGWHAYAGGAELKVWPANIAMRGILVPAGVTEIELRFEPFFTSWPARISVVAGLLLGTIGWLVFRRLDRASGAPRGPAAAPVERREVSLV